MQPEHRKTMHDCPSPEVFARLLGNQLDAAEQEEVTEHVAACESCRQKLFRLCGDREWRPAAPPPAGTDDIEQKSEQATPVHQQQTVNQWGGGADVGDGGESPASSIETVAARPAPVDPQAPLSLSDFGLIAEIGSGGMGTVFRAVQKSLNKPVAIKMLSRVASGDAPLVKRFLREASAAAGMRHPNIVDVHGVGRTQDGGYFLVMDLVEGANLEELVQSDRIPMENVPELVATIADAVERAHQHDVVHRDLKPSNILVDASGRVMVTDFGIAKLLSNDQTNLTGTDAGIIGTPSYMAPEQIDPRWGEVGFRADVYGLGGILYYLLTGQHPFPAEGRGNIAVLARVASEILPDAPSTIRRDTPAVLEAICLKCLSKEQAGRYATAGEVASTLRCPDTVSVAGASLPRREPPKGAVPPDSPFYLERDVDEAFHAAVGRRDSIILLRGARQMGKTSLLARGLAQARRAGLNVVLTDCSKLSTSDLATAESLFRAFGELMADALDLEVFPEDVWNRRRGPSVNFDRYLRREVLAKTDGELVWALDEVDRLFTCEFRSDVFGLFRSWHNERALDPSGPWSRLSLAIAYATEVRLFITDINQSPFNVGTRLNLQDFTRDQVSNMNQRYGSPLQDDAQVERFHALLAGHPYLTNLGLYEMASRQLDIAAFEQQAELAEGFFGDHLQRILAMLTHDEPLRESAQGVIDGHGCSSAEAFYRLRSAGVVAGKSPRDTRFRCQLYEKYLTQHML